MSTQLPPNRNTRSTTPSGMDRLVDAAVDDLVERQADPLARRLVSGGPVKHRPGVRGADRVPESEASLAALQEILLGTDRDQIQQLNTELDVLRHQISDKEALAAAVAPILGDAIRQQIRESREEIIDALYPIIGQIVVRAVTEAMRDLARSIDEKLQAATDVQRMGRRLRSLVTGVPATELALRSGLPFVIQEIYLIHRESGLLLWHATRESDNGADSELIGSMLTAIREFSEQVLGGGKEPLYQLQFGNRELALEFARYSYVGVILEGVVPANFRWKLHKHIYAFEKNSVASIRHFDGDAAPMRAIACREFKPFLSVGT